MGGRGSWIEALSAPIPSPSATQELLVVPSALIKMTCSWRFCLESKKPGELAVDFTNTTNDWVGFFLEIRLLERWHGRFKYEYLFVRAAIKLPKEEHYF